MLSFRSLSGLGTFRRIVAITLRSLLILFVTLALAEIRLTQPNDTVTVLFLVDRSLSVPPDYDPDADPDSKEGRIDRRWERVRDFMCKAVEKRGDRHQRDQAGVILFGRRPRLELPPKDVPAFTKIPGPSSIQPPRLTATTPTSPPPSSWPWPLSPREPPSGLSCSVTATRTSAMPRSRPDWPNRTACRSMSFLWRIRAPQRERSPGAERGSAAAHRAGRPLPDQRDRAQLQPAAGEGRRELAHDS